MIDQHTLGELLPWAALPPQQAALVVRGVTADSREVGPGIAFVAVAGLTVDGHDFARQAIAAGAVAVIAGRPLDLDGAPCVVVDDTSRALGLMAARLEGEPAEQLSLIGITGTNGKTTTTYLIEAMLAASGARPGIVGTVSYRYAGHETKAPYTTPTPVLLQRLLRQMVAAGCTHAALEVSSHALQLGRVWGSAFDVCAFSHLSQDHLDLHGDMERYLRAKLRLFDHHLRPGGTAVVNVDGAGSDEVLQTVRRRGDVRLLRCSRRDDDDAEATLRQLRCDLSGLRGQLLIAGEAIDFHAPLVGSFNADNLLLAAACCWAAGAPLGAIAEGIAAQRPVPGRLERVSSETGDAGAPTVLVDYAHTPDALARALAVLRPLTPGRLVVVFGCGGDRDRGKRSLMGQAVARGGADRVIVTSDNPRTEDPQAIIGAILPGLRDEQLAELTDVGLLAAARGRSFAVEADRARAIAAAIGLARPGDLVLIAGKGHEDYQIVGQRRIHFDDREQAREALLGRDVHDASDGTEPGAGGDSDRTGGC